MTAIDHASAAFVRLIDARGGDVCGAFDSLRCGLDFADVVYAHRAALGYSQELTAENPEAVAVTASLTVAALAVLADREQRQQNIEISVDDAARCARLLTFMLQTAVVAGAPAPPARMEVEMADFDSAMRLRDLLRAAGCEEA